MAKLNWNAQGFSVDGVPAYLVSGEFHYFRVPPEDWARRMRLFREAGGNCIATYVPWLIHEPQEGQICFGDQPKRDLARFLETARQQGLMVVLRPGPYQYSELVHSGLPRWLVEDYPQLLARDARGRVIHESSISYLHPLFLEKARRYYRAFAQVVRPYLASNGGPVCMLQVDNELAGIHLWRSSMDYNPEAMGFGRADGRYPRWLRARYSEIEALNEAYGTRFEDFSAVMPSDRIEGAPPEQRRRMRDYARFYCSTLAEYAQKLAGWLREEGITEPLCHNSANPNMNSLFLETVEQMGAGFLLGSDHYYTLGPSWPQNSPTPQYALRVLLSCELLRAMGMPPTVFELPAGNLSDTPPILAEDLMACYQINAAMGMKGLNYYIYTGGPNFLDTGTTGELYDYHAPVSAGGELNKTYQALKAFGLFLQEHGWMQRAGRVASVQLGFTWEESRFQEYEPPVEGMSQQEAWEMLEKGVLYAMMAGCCAPELKALTGTLDSGKPLVVVCPSCMSLEAQRAVMAFVEAGGQALVMPVLPEWDEEGRPACLLKAFSGLANLREVERPGSHIRVEEVGSVYLIDRLYTADLPEGARPIAWDDRSGCVVGAEMSRGRGKLLWLGTQFKFQLFDQARLMEAMALRMGGREVVSCDNRNLFTALWSDGERALAYVLNPYSGRQRARVRVRLPQGWRELGELELGPMEIHCAEL